jgi:hypothetical protein
LVAIAFSTLFLQGCSSNSSFKQDPSITISVAPTAASVVAAKTQQFAATVTGTTNTAVTWQVNSVTGGDSTHGTISTSGLYTAPSAVPNPASVTVTAIAQADSTKSASAAVTVTAAQVPVAISISPTAASVVAAKTQQFAATVTGTTNMAVSWQVNSVTGGDPTHGTISISGLYTAPSAVPSPATVTVTAIAQADSTKSAAAAVTITASGGSNITVSVSPQRGGLTVTQQLSTLKATLTNDTTNAGVTWSSSGGGSFLPTTSLSGVAVTFTAPSSAGVVTITATSVADSSKTATATIGVTNLAGVLTYHNDLSRDGANQQEYALTTSNVATTTFGKLFSCQVDGAIYAQPLWIPRVSIGGVMHNVVLVATMHDTVYLLDADGSQATPPQCVTFWSKQLLPAGETWGSYADVGSTDIFPDIGILGTPVVDPSTNVVYLVAKSKTISGGAYQQRLYALNLADGSEHTAHVSIDNSITVPGTCDGGSTVVFNPLRENQRAGLALANGTLYAAWGSHGDTDQANGGTGQYHGWVISFNSSTLARTNVWNSTPNSLSGIAYCRGGIWMSGGAPAIDSGNNVFVMTGNGIFDASSGGSNYGDSYMKLSSSLGVSDYFTPHNQSFLDDGDTDVGAGGTALLIDQNSGPIAHLMIGAGKSGTFYLLNRDNLGHFNISSDSAAVQSWTATGTFSTPAFWNNNMFFFGVVFKATQVGQQYTFNPSTGMFTTTAASSTPTGFGFPGATPSVSSNGTSSGTGIVWAIDNSNFGTSDGGVATAGPAILHAYSAANLGTELWNSSQGSGNAAGFAVKFTLPTVANGKVYVGTRGNDNTNGSGTVFGELDVYGLLP